MNSVLNLDFLYCYRCKRQPIEQDNSPFVVCVCKHIFCNKCKRCNQTRDLVYCSVCHKRVKFMPITPQDLPVNVRSSFESTNRLVEHFESSAEFQDNIQSNCTDQLIKGIEFWDSVSGEQDAIVNKMQARCQTLENEISKIEAKSLQHMSRGRYAQLLKTAEDKIKRMNYRQLVEDSSSEDHTHSTPRPFRSSVSAIDPDTPLLRQVLLKNAFPSSLSGHSPQ